VRFNAKRILFGAGEPKKEGFEEAVKSSFSKVKEHITVLESGIKEERTNVLSHKEAILSLKTDIELNKSNYLSQNESISSILAKLDTLFKRLDEIEAKINDFNVSIGNQGVYSNIHSFNRYSFIQQKQGAKQEVSGQKIDTADDPPESMPAVTNDMPQGQLHYAPEEKYPRLVRETLQDIKPKMIKQERPLQAIAASRQELMERFSSLSKQELKTFLTIYDMGDEKGNASYSDVAKRLNLSEGCIRTYISGLMRKKIPVEKIKYNNKAVFLHIPKEFRELSLKGELVSIYYDTSLPQQRRLTDSV